MAKKKTNNRKNPKGRTLYLIDGHAQFYRAYHAIRSNFTSPVTGEPTNLTFGFVGMLLKVLREYQPDYLAVVIDASGDRETFRSEIYPQYKATRPEPPDDMHAQIERCLNILDTMGVPVIAEEGVEADDVIASLVRRLEKEHPDLNIRIVSKDKDLAQLLDEHIELFDVHTDKSVDASDIFKAEDVQPQHVRDILALMGDTIDNIPGVEGIGPKIAAKLILEYGSVENLYNHLDDIKGKRRANLEAAKDVVPVSKQLVQLRDDLDVNLDLDQARVDTSKLPARDLIATMKELGFSRHEDDLRAIVGEAASGDGASSTTQQKKKEQTSQGGLFDQTDDEHLDVASTDASLYKTITTKKALDDLIKQIKKAGRCAVDVESDSLKPIDANLCGVAIAIEPETGFYIPTRSPQPGKHLDTETVIEKLRPVLEDAQITKMGHNLKYDINVLRTHGLQLAAPMFDTMVASYVVDATRSSHKLDALALAFLGYTCRTIEELIGKKGPNQRGFDRVPLDTATPYAAEDVDITLRLHDTLAPQIKAMQLENLFHEVEMPLVKVLAELEYNGIRVDPAELDRQRDKLAERIEQIKTEIASEAPHEFSPDSPRQLAAVLFNKPDDDPPGLGLRATRHGKTGPSTDQEVLERLASDPETQTEIPGKVLEYRQLTKLVNTYLAALKQYINERTGRVHASFNQTVTATGRLSSSDPNLQNIPIRTEIGREIRRAFVAEKNYVLLTADYSQIELRLLAHLANDEALIEAFNEGQDIHRAVAAEVFGVEPEEVTSEQRSAAKMVNFGIVYGVTPWGLARRLGADTPVERAKQIIDDYKARFAGINRFLDECIQQALTYGYVETILKRRRKIPQIESRQPQTRSLGERMAINTVVQGSAADLIKRAMIDLHRRLPGQFPDVKMCLQIHDELVFEVPERGIDAVEPFIRDRMERAMDLAVPLEVETAWSANWIDAK